MLDLIVPQRVEDFDERACAGQGRQLDDRLLDDDGDFDQGSFAALRLVVFVAIGFVAWLLVFLCLLLFLLLVLLVFLALGLVAILFGMCGLRRRVGFWLARQRSALELWRST